MAAKKNTKNANVTATTTVNTTADGKVIPKTIKPGITGADMKKGVKTPKAPKEPKAPKTPKAAKEPKAPKTPKEHLANKREVIHGILANLSTETPRTIRDIAKQLMTSFPNAKGTEKENIMLVTMFAKYEVYQGLLKNTPDGYIRIGVVHSIAVK